MKHPIIASACVVLLFLLSGLALAAEPRIASPNVSNLTGQLLVASQQLTDPNFAKTVIYIVSYSEQGSMGVIVNRAIGTTNFQNLLAAIGIKSRVKKEVVVYMGGPVEIRLGFILHSPDYTAASTQQLGSNIAVSTGPDVLQALAEGKGPKQSRLMFGYAGWGAKQLDHELARGDWLIAPADPALIFSTDDQAMWAKALLQAGISL